MAATEKQKEIWNEQRKDLLNKIRDTLNGFRRQARLNAIFHQFLSLSLLVFSILAPIASAKASALQAPLYWSNAAIVLSIGVAFCEGLRRLYRPDQRWRATAFVIQEIVAVRENFNQADIEFETGSLEWIDAFVKLNNDFLALIKKDMEDFFKNSAAKHEDPPTRQNNGA